MWVVLSSDLIDPPYVTMPAPLVEKRASIYSVVWIPRKKRRLQKSGHQASFERCGCCVMPFVAHIVNVTPGG